MSSQVRLCFVEVVETFRRTMFWLIVPCLDTRGFLVGGQFQERAIGEGHRGADTVDRLASLDM